MLDQINNKTTSRPTAQRDWPTARVTILFQNWVDFLWLFHDHKLKKHDLLAQHILQSKQFTTYKCVPELVFIIQEKIKPIIYLDNIAMYT